MARTPPPHIHPYYNSRGDLLKPGRFFTEPVRNEIAQILVESRPSLPFSSVCEVLINEHECFKITRLGERKDPL
ncbi:hypothetical protein J6590_085271 [Homalodisca vitripennis]|nr:hypothetical protein J6590_085271 [Homalodisca vitripennis]